MILYFTDRSLNVIGKASTSLPNGHGIINDSKVEDIETMAVSLECDVLYEDSSQEVESYTTPGNYVLRKCKKDKDILFQIIEAEKDDDAGTWHIYCEDVGLDLLDEVALKTNNAKNLTVMQAVNNTIIGSGYEIGINKVTDNTTKLCEFSEQTRSERLKEIAELFEVELDYRFTLSEDGHTVNHKYIDIYKKRGSNNGVFLRKGRDIDNITITKSIENLATSLYAYGDADDSGVPVTLDGYKYDDAQYTKVIKELFNISPNAKVFIETCPKVEGDRYVGYNQAVHDIYDALKSNYPNLHLLDLFKYYNMYTNTSLANDSLAGHYTAIGYQQFAQILSVILSSYINEHISDFQDVAFIEYDN